ncbi:MAG TPA: hypothetical protein VKQ72_20415 [Aggregatilineales bacterium]|nr:hypothetical protein [Aggregatilineales bacterium]
MQDVIKLSYQVQVEKSVDGQRSARLIPVLTHPTTRCSISQVSLTAHQFGETKDGFRPAINHTAFVLVTLYWVPDYPEEETFSGIENWIWFQIKDSMLKNEVRRLELLNSLDGSDWYIHTERVK